MKKFMFAAMAALVLVSCTGAAEKVDSAKIKDSIAKAEEAKKAKEAVKENVEEVATTVESLEVSTNPECATEGIEPAGN